MIKWNFNPNEVEEKSYSPLPIGEYRVRIENVEEGQGDKYPYYKLTLQVNGDNRKLWYYLSFMDGEKSRFTNTNLSNIWNSFDIPVGELNPDKWIGKVGACRVKHDMYNGQERAKIAYFLNREQQDKLPPWEDTNTPYIDSDFSLLMEDDDVPF